MNYIKNVLKRTPIILLVALLLLILYFVVFPVRTLGEVLERRNINYLSENYEYKEYEHLYLVPESLPGLQDDVLSVRGEYPSFSDFDLSSPQNMDTVAKLLSSLKVRKKMGEYHSSSNEHRCEDGYEYHIHFRCERNLDLILCKQELCFQCRPEERYGAYRFNAYTLVRCPENERILDELLKFMTEKSSYYKDQLLD